ncbi:hypothetical protein J6590_069880 [Homalodisca vitripennis]|nr:hypothetical protein J6590_069880 [Homalodisca vitripennis]
MGVQAGNQNALEFGIKLESALSTASGTFTSQLLITSRLVESVALVAGSLSGEALEPRHGASPDMSMLLRPVVNPTRGYLFLTRRGATKIPNFLLHRAKATSTTKHKIFPYQHIGVVEVEGQPPLSPYKL